jgi:hypothetical protein
MTVGQAILPAAGSQRRQTSSCVQGACLTGNLREWHAYFLTVPESVRVARQRRPFDEG